MVSTVRQENDCPLLTQTQELATPSPVRRKECQDANAQLSLTTPSPKFSTTKITSDSKSSLTPPRSSSPPQDELHLSNNRKQSEDDDIHSER